MYIYLLCGYYVYLFTMWFFEKLSCHFVTIALHTLKSTYQSSTQLVYILAIVPKITKRGQYDY